VPRNQPLAIEYARMFLAAAIEPLRSMTTRYELPSERDLSAQAHAERYEVLADIYRVGAGYEDVSVLDATELRLLPRVPRLRVANGLELDGLQAMADAAADAGLVPEPSPVEERAPAAQDELLSRALEPKGRAS
jgi:hypothetical protein